MSRITMKPRDVRGAGSRFPVYRVDELGDAREVGVLLVDWDGYYWEPTSAETPKMFRHLPWFIQDMRPDGFIGKAFAQRVYQELGFPKQFEDWNDDHVLVALARRGDDCVGNVIVGDEALERYTRSVREFVPPIQPRAIEIEYPRLARSALDGDSNCRLVGGIQPKFITVTERDGNSCNVLVKFSPNFNTPTGRRWADLLICEHLALETIRNAGRPASKSRLIVTGDRVFLEVERFDRVGRFGRCPINSLGVVDDDFFGHRDNWSAMAERLESAEMVSFQDSDTLRWLQAFGEMIANTDMHFGNVSLIMKDPAKPTFKLAPAYDMLPMLYRPREGKLSSLEFTFPDVASTSQWKDVRQCALQFWESAALDKRISVEFREVCKQNWKILGRTPEYQSI